MIKYRVKPGDTLWKIARKFDITLRDIIEANPWLKEPCPRFGGVLIILFNFYIKVIPVI